MRDAHGVPPPHVWAPENALSHPWDLPSSAIPTLPGSPCSCLPSHCQGEKPSAHEPVSWRREPADADKMFAHMNPSRAMLVLTPACQSDAGDPRPIFGARLEAPARHRRSAGGDAGSGQGGRAAFRAPDDSNPTTEGWGGDEARPGQKMEKGTQVGLPPSTDHGCLDTAAAPRAHKPAPKRWPKTCPPTKRHLLTMNTLCPSLLVFP